MLLLFATTALEKLQKVPASFWINAALVIVVFLAIVFVVKNAMRMNKIVLSIIVVVVVSLVGFQWIYERNEPEFMTPMVDSIAPFFPGKNSYEGTQQQDPNTPGRKKSARPTGR